MNTLRQLYRTILLNDTPKAKAIRVSQGLHNYIAPTRVKRRSKCQSRENPCNADSETAERAANMDAVVAKFTAVLSPQSMEGV